MALMDENGSNGFYMPVAPAYSNNNGNGNNGNGFGQDGWWIILLFIFLAALGNGFGGGFGGGGSQPIIMTDGASGGTGRTRTRTRTPRRDGMGRYSRADGSEHIVKKLESLMREASDAEVRDAISTAIDAISVG